MTPSARVVLPESGTSARARRGTQYNGHISYRAKCKSGTTPLPEPSARLPDSYPCATGAQR